MNTLHPKLPLLFALLFALAFAGLTLAQDQDDQAGRIDKARQASPVFAGDPYLLDVDVVTGKALGPLADQVVIDHDGRELRFSSEKSLKAFRADPKPIVERIDALMVADQLPLYPLETCMVSGERLGGEEMGEPINLIHKNRLVRVCCKMCIKKFHKNADRMIADLDAAVIKAQTKAYPLATCVVSGEELGGMGDVIDRVVGGRLVRLCCKMCTKKLNKDPRTVIAKLDAARSSEKPGEHKRSGDGEGHGRHDG